MSLVGKYIHVVDVVDTYVLYTTMLLYYVRG